MTTDTVAAVVRWPDRTFELERVALTDVREDELLVRVVAVGMCHTDLSIRDRLRAAPAGAAPAILGHEGAGVVEFVGPAVTTVKPGDHVLLSFDSCGRCHSCVAGSPSLCELFFAVNMSGRRADGTTAAATPDGESVENRWFAQSSFADYAVTTERNTVVVDDDVPLEVLAPLGCGVQTGAGAVLNVMDLAPGQSLVVFGAGAVGLSAVMAAKIAGARHIVVVDRNPARLALALELGATQTAEGADELPDHAEALGGFDFSLESTGVPALLRLAVTSLRMGGTCVSVAPGEIEMSRSDAVGRTLVFSLEGGAVPQLFLPRLIEFWRAGMLPIEKLITTYPLADAERAAADSLSGATVKPVLIP